jgi:hypothetical protein
MNEYHRTPWIAWDSSDNISLWREWENGDTVYRPTEDSAFKRIWAQMRRRYPEHTRTSMEHQIHVLRAVKADIRARHQQTLYDLLKAQDKTLLWQRTKGDRWVSTPVAR